MVGLIVLRLLVITLFQKMAEFRVIFNSLDFVSDDVLYILLYLRVVSLYFSSHLGLVLGIILEVRNERNWLIMFLFMATLSASTTISA